jgi:hypothetical protein
MHGGLAFPYFIDSNFADDDSVIKVAQDPPMGGQFGLNEGRLTADLDRLLWCGRPAIGPEPFGRLSGDPVNEYFGLQVSGGTSSGFRDRTRMFKT